MTRHAFNDTRRPKALARRIHAALRASPPVPTLSAVREALARTLGHDGWHALERACRPGAPDGVAWDPAALASDLAVRLVDIGATATVARAAASSAFPATTPRQATGGVATAFGRWLATTVVTLFTPEVGLPQVRVVDPDGALADVLVDAHFGSDGDVAQSGIATVILTPQGERRPDLVTVRGWDLLLPLLRDRILALASPVAPSPPWWPRSQDLTGALPSVRSDLGGGGLTLLLGAFEVASGVRVSAPDLPACREVADAWVAGDARFAFEGVALAIDLPAIACAWAVPAVRFREEARLPTDLGEFALSSVLDEAPLLGAVVGTHDRVWASGAATADEALHAIRHAFQDVGVRLDPSLPWSPSLPPLGRFGYDAVCGFPFSLPVGWEAGPGDGLCPLVAATATLIVSGFRRASMVWTPGEAGALLTISRIGAELLPWWGPSRGGDADAAEPGPHDHGALAPGRVVPTVSCADLRALLGPHLGDLAGLLARVGLAAEPDPGSALAVGAAALGIELDGAADLPHPGRVARLRHRLLASGLEPFAAEAMGALARWRVVASPYAVVAPRPAAVGATTWGPRVAPPASVVGPASQAA